MEHIDPTLIRHLKISLKAVTEGYRRGMGKSRKKARQEVDLKDLDEALIRRASMSAHRLRDVLRKSDEALVQHVREALRKK